MRVSVLDGGGLSDDVTLMITVLRNNVAPTFVDFDNSGFSVAIISNVTNNSIIYDAQASDTDQDVVRRQLCFVCYFEITIFWLTGCRLCLVLPSILMLQHDM